MEFKVTPKMIGLALLGILVLVVLVQNTQVVSFHFLFWKASMSAVFLFPLVLFVGFLIGFFVGKRPWD